MKTVVGISHFFKNNTPKFWQIIGDLGLAAASVSGFIIGLQATLQGCGVNFVMPPLLMQVNTVCLVVGALVKFITKFVGQKESPIIDTSNKNI